ncbi:glycine-rich protein [Streptomyces sp. NPDC093982]|uniref:glycine-rich protein n=1 Tax=Streptomyces sp. NPDC093982 TaxID=3155077 RepID=UPI0034371F81
MGLRRFGAFIASLSLAAMSLVGLSASSATALTAPVAMTADDLPTWQTNGIVWAMAQADGVVFTGGTFSAIRPPGAPVGTEERQAVNFAALDAATGKPTSCDLSFTVGSGLATVRALAVSPDHKTLYAGGRFGSVNGLKVSNAVAIDIKTCTPKAGFKPSANATVRALAATSNDVYLGGDFTTVAGQARPYFASVTTSGALRPWRADADKVGRAIEVTPDGKNVILGGDFYHLNGSDSHALAIVNSTSGALTKNYPASFFKVDYTRVKDITIAGTSFYTASEGSFDGRVAFNLDGFNQRWRDDCYGATQAVEVYKGMLYSASHAWDCSLMGTFNSPERRYLLAESVNDPTLLGWFPKANAGIGEQLGPRVITTASKGGTDYMWVGGEFTAINGKPQQALTRFASGPDTGAPPVPKEVVASSTIPGQVDLSWQSSLDLDDTDLTYRIYRNGSDKPISTITRTSLPWDRPQLDFSDTEATPGSTYTYRITVSDGAGNTSARSAPVTVKATASGPAAKPCKPSAPFNTCIDFTYSGGTQTITIPKGVTSMKATLLGASAYGPYGGRGGQATGTVAVTPGQKITVTVGQQGRYESGGRVFGGGGAGGAGCTDLCGSAGGGMSSLWKGAPNVAGNALLVAGGGGGAGNARPAQMRGGDGGGAAGGTGQSHYGGGGGGATRNAGGNGGAPFQCSFGGGSGSQFEGGNGSSGYESGSGGGGGWFGGGGGGCGGVTQAYGGAGGGGSSYVSGPGVTGGTTRAGVNPASAHGDVKLEFTKPSKHQ